MQELEHLHAIRATLPDTTERLSHGAPRFSSREKRCSDPEKFFRPPYVGHRGRLGVMLHGRVDRDEIEGSVEDAYATVSA